RIADAGTATTPSDWPDPLAAGAERPASHLRASCLNGRGFASQQHLGQAVRVGGQSERLGRLLVEVAGPKPSAARNMGEARERLHDRQQAWIVQLEAWRAPPAGGDARLAQACQLPAIDVGLEHVLLDGEVAIIYAAHDA